MLPAINPNVQLSPPTSPEPTVSQENDPDFILETSNSYDDSSADDDRSDGNKHLSNKEVNVPKSKWHNNYFY